MAKVPSLPSNGQPIDTQYIYDIVNSIININAEISTLGTSNVVVRKVKSAGNAKTNSINFDAQTVNVVKASKVSKSTPKTGIVNFNTTFNQVPVVTATLVSSSSGSVNASVTITSIDQSTMSYKVSFDSDGTTTLDLNIIAIGV
jgi:hypothetical protein